MFFLKRKKGQKEYNAKKEIARKIIMQRLVELNQGYGFLYKKVAIRNQKTRWGSCSKSGNLNFNYKIAFLGSEVLDYVIVHELCHLKEFNHSQNFWDLVAVEIPDYQEIQDKMKKVLS